MTTGMYWFFGKSKKNLSTLIANAAKYYRMKYNIIPDVCLISPHDYDSKAFVEGIQIGEYDGILPSHLWIGVKEK